MRLKDQVAIVTGATRGIGQAIAVRFGQEGARVAVVGRDQEKGRETVRLIEAAGGQASFLPTDISDGTLVQAMVDAVVDRWGRIDILVNNAAICPFEDFLEMSEALWDQVLDVNLKGYFLCSQAVARVMVELGIKGRIIAVSSISAEFGGSQQAHYCASKAGINLLVKSMAISLGPHGITCNAVLPGTVETDINREALSDPEVRGYWLNRGPIGDDSAWCTGSMLVVDGGVSVNLQ
jgi:L-rhamnose 1-dehydrogenase